jgi:hypothetical protein
VVLFVSVSYIEIGIDKEFDSIGGTLTEKTSSTGETDVNTVLRFKNPLVRHHHRIHFSRRRCTEQSLLECTPLIFSGVLFLVGNTTGELEKASEK